MWKWIAIGWIVVLALGFGCWSAARKVAGGGPPVVAIHAPASRVWASLATIDSFSTWRSDFPRNQSQPHHSGGLQAGDTVRPPALLNASAQIWVVQEVVPEHLLVSRQFIGGSGLEIIERRDSLSERGDSTVVLSTLGLVDSATRGSTGMRLVVSMMRPGLRIDLDRLKRRIERGTDTLHKPVDPLHRSADTLHK
ncbi:MAG TPA: hypothetical protein VHW65_01130 [Gemmatimonadales bacterium]|jgi:hypothetical protein|nr:hypothetical protein [Gemmatimonadales bacterium]